MFCYSAAKTQKEKKGLLIKEKKKGSYLFYLTYGRACSSIYAKTTAKITAKQN